MTLHPFGVVSGGDLDAARRVAAGEGGICHHLLGLDDAVAPYTDVTEVPPTDEPAPSTTTFARYRAELDLLRELGSECHLTGDGGDAVLTAPQDYLCDLVMAGNIRELWRHCMGWARLHNGSTYNLLVAAIRASRNCGAQLAEPSPDPRTSNSASWFTPEARAASTTLTSRHRFTFDVPICAGDRAALAGITFIGRCDRSDAQLTESLGVPLHNPFLDSAVIDACLRVPAAVRTSPFAVKPLLRAALRDTVPPFVFDRRTKGDFTSDEYRGMRANIGPLRGLFTRPRLADLGIIEPRAVHATVDHAVAGLPFDLAGLDALVAAEAWLGVMAMTPRPGWTRPHAQVA